jgi:hypothetical protein
MVYEMQIQNTHYMRRLGGRHKTNQLCSIVTPENFHGRYSRTFILFLVACRSNLTQFAIAKCKFRKECQKHILTNILQLQEIPKLLEPTPGVTLFLKVYEIKFNKYN